MAVINTINQKFADAYNVLIKNNKPEDMKTLFDDEASVTDAKKDEVKNKHSAADVRTLVKSDKKDKTAVQLAADKTDKFNKKLEAKKEVKFMGYEVKAAKAKDNVAEITVTVDGKKCKGTISYAKDNSCVMQLDTGKETITKVADKNGVTREKIVKNSETNQTTTSSYDESGKINKKQVINGNTVVTTYYDDNGQATKKIKNDGVNTTTSLYEYDKNGDKLGTYSEIVNNTTKEKTTKTTLIDPKNGTKTSTETKTNGTIVVRTSKKNKDGKWEIQTKEVTNKDNKTARYEYSNVKYNEDGTSARDRKVTASDGKVYYEVQTLNQDGKAVATKRYADEKHEQPLSEKEFKYDKDGHNTETVRTVKDKDGKTKRTVETKYDVQTGKPSNRMETSFDADGKQTGTKEFNYESGSLVSSIFKFKDDTDKDVTENRTYFGDGSEKTITNETYGFTITKNTKGVITQIEFKNVNPDNVIARTPQDGPVNGSIPLFNSEGVLIGNADYDSSGKFQKIDWKNGFGPAATDAPAVADASSCGH